MSWVNGFYAWLFGVRPQAGAPANASAQGEAGLGGASASDGTAETRSETAKPPEETLYEHSPTQGISQSKQHAWLFDEGVLHWNQHRRETAFKPAFPGVNFVKQAAKTRLWGLPSDLTGDERVLLAGVDFRLADLQGCNLAKADLRHSKLQGANLRNANLSGAIFESADLTDCDLRGAVLDGADLSRTRLVNANLSGASLKSVNFAWADMSHTAVGAKALTDVNLFGVVRREFPADAVT